MAVKNYKSFGVVSKFIKIVILAGARAGQGRAESTEHLSLFILLLKINPNRIFCYRLEHILLLPIVIFRRPTEFSFLLLFFCFLLPSNLKCRR